MVSRQLELTVAHASGRSPLAVTIDRLVVAGWVGRDKAALGHHIEELGKLGVPAPSRTPTYMNLSPMILTTGDTMAVVGPESSGEVECVLIKDGDAIFVGVGSDHTDRAFEKYDIPASKQVCAKPVAPVVWELGQVRGHLDRIVLRSWMTTGGKRRQYQEGRLAANIDVMEILDNIPTADGLDMPRLCLFCGTFPAIGGIECGQRFEFEMEDPVLQRKIHHAYQVTCLPQYL
ncbi:MAG: DUF2848 family protein [Desulfatitalea sp.]|nr:DUF2848 family protein [Desulfatitalea sp.]